MRPHYFFEYITCAPGQWFAQTEQLCDQIHRQPAGNGEQPVKGGHRNPGIIHCTVGSRQKDAQFIPKRTEVLTAGIWERHGCKLIRVNYFICGEGDLLLQETKIETDAVAEDRGATTKDLQRARN